ncbi:MAG: methyl-accepting chemotaxis protein [Calditrichaeota bacterium]|nr:MAG: methyl-accepting chemotaxis protein [Calditrichota bacterium]
MNDSKRYAVAGAVFGTCFPIMAFIIRVLQYGLHQAMVLAGEDPLLWIIASAPIFLGLAAFYAGVKQDNVNQKMAEINSAQVELEIAHGETLQKSDLAEKAARAANEARHASDEQKQYLGKSVEVLLHEIDKFSRGDLTISLACDKADDVGRLYNGLTKAISLVHKNLYEVVESTQTATNSAAVIFASNEKLLQSANDLSKHTIDVAGAVEQVSITIDENSTNSNSIMEFVKKSTDSAKKASNSVAELIDGVLLIKGTVNEAANNVASLGESSQQIGEIVQTISDIADQTNLLALNAAIEAARAGEQGRGFAVVADEVRKLAVRTAEATKEIKSNIITNHSETDRAIASIQRTMEALDERNNLIDKTKEDLSEIAMNSDQTLNMITQIATSGKEQAIASSEISRTITGINKITQSQYEEIQGITESTQQLNELMHDLHLSLQHFQFYQKPGKTSEVLQKGKNGKYFDNPQAVEFTR